MPSKVYFGVILVCINSGLRFFCMQNSFEMRLEKFRRSIDRLGIQAHANFIAFLLILLYFFVSVTATTHEDILKETPKAIPLLSIQVPFLCFAFIGPWIILLVHLNQLFQYYYLSKNTFVLKKIISGLLQPAANDEVSSTSYFLVTNLILTDSCFLRVTIKFFLWIFLVVGPVVICVLFLGCFLPYHSLWMTWNHRIVIVLDVAAIFCFWPKILFGETGRFEAAYFNNFFRRISAPVVECGMVTVFFVFAALVSCGVLCVPGEFLDIYPAEVQCKNSAYTDSGLDEPDILEGGLKGIVANVYLYSQRFFPRNLDLANRLLIKSEPSYALISQYSKNVSSYYPTLVGLIKEQGLGLDLRRRDLRYANFSGSYMPSCSFVNADLSHSNFSFGHFENSFFGVLSSEIETVLRNYTRSSSKNIAYEKKIDEILYQEYDSLCDKILSFSERSYFSFSVWPGSAKKYTSISHVNFSSANLSGASFVDVQSAYSDFSMALLEGCRFHNSCFFGANFHSASIKSSLFLNFDLVLSNVSVADFYKSHFYNCRFIGTTVTLSSLVNVLMVRVGFDASAIMSSVFEGSVFVSANIQNSIFYDSVFTSVVFRKSMARNCVFQQFFIENGANDSGLLFQLFLSEKGTDAPMAAGSLVKLVEKCVDNRSEQLEKIYPIEVDQKNIRTENNIKYREMLSDEFAIELGRKLKKYYCMGPGPSSVFYRNGSIFSIIREEGLGRVEDAFDEDPACSAKWTELGFEERTSVPIY